MQVGEGSARAIVESEARERPYAAGCSELIFLLDRWLASQVLLERASVRKLMAKGTLVGAETFFKLRLVGLAEGAQGCTKIVGDGFANTGSPALGQDVVRCEVFSAPELRRILLGVIKTILH